MLIPEDNSITEAKVVFGLDLYFDKRLSLDNTVSCATCHNPKLPLRMLNVFQIINPVEMGMPTHDTVVDKVKKDKDYVKRFKKVFGGPVTIDHITKAIAAF